MCKLLVGSLDLHYSNSHVIIYEYIRTWSICELSDCICTYLLYVQNYSSCRNFLYWRTQLLIVVLCICQEVRQAKLKSDARRRKPDASSQHRSCRWKRTFFFHAVTLSLLSTISRIPLKCLSSNKSCRKWVIVLMRVTEIGFEFPKLLGQVVLVFTRIKKLKYPINCIHVFCVLMKCVEALRMLSVPHVSV